MIATIHPSIKNQKPFLKEDVYIFLQKYITLHLLYKTLYSRHKKSYILIMIYDKF